MKLLAHDITVVHRKGTSNNLPDALSRMYEEDEPEVAELNALESFLSNITTNINTDTVADTNTATATKSSDWYDKRVNSIKNQPRRYPNWKVENDQLFYRTTEQLENDIARDGSEWKLVIPDDERPEILAEAHDALQAGHGGVDKTLVRLSTRYFWPGMYKDVFDNVQECETCKLNKMVQRRPLGLLGQRFISQPWSRPILWAHFRVVKRANSIFWSSKIYLQNGLNLCH